MTDKLSTLAQQVRFLLGEHPDGFDVDMVANLTHMVQPEERASLICAIASLESHQLIEADLNGVYTLINDRSNSLFIDLAGAADIEHSLEDSISTINKTLDNYLLQVGDREIIQPLLAARLNAEAALQRYRNQH